MSASVMLSLDAGPAGLALSQGAEHIMLHLDDELAGLIEAADVPAGQDKIHSTQPDAVSLVPGEPSGVHYKSAAGYFAHLHSGIVLRRACCVVLCCVYMLCCAVPCRAVLGWAGLCCAVLCCAVLCCAVLCCAVLCCAVLCCAVPCCAVLCLRGFIGLLHGKTCLPAAPECVDKPL